MMVGVWVLVLGHDPALCLIGGFCVVVGWDEVVMATCVRVCVCMCFL